MADNTLTVQDFETAHFPTLKKSGFDPDSVLLFLSKAKHTVGLLTEANAAARRAAADAETQREALASEVEQLKQQVLELTETASSQANPSTQSIKVLEMAQETASRLVQEAEADAQRAREQALDETRALVAQAKQQSTTLLSEAEEEHRVAVERMELERQALSHRVNELREHALSIHQQLTTFYTERLNTLPNPVVENLPEAVEAQVSGETDAPFQGGQSQAGEPTEDYSGDDAEALDALLDTLTPVARLEESEFALDDDSQERSSAETPSAAAHSGETAASTSTE